MERDMPDLAAAQASLARSYFRAARMHAEANDLRGALDRVEHAARLDAAGALDGYALFRAMLYQRVGIAAPMKALRLYEQAFLAQERRDYEDALALYGEADVADAGFHWSANNAAWLLATCPRHSVRNGSDAVRYAERTCEATEWSYWCFLGTLAAAYAQSGELTMAVQYQKESLLFTPEDHEEGARAILKCFERGDAFTDYGIKIAAGAPSVIDDEYAEWTPRTEGCQ